MRKPSLSRRGRTEKGKYVPQNIRKYIGDPDRVYYRSGWEKKVCIWCDTSPNVLMWGSEEVSVSYISAVDKKQRQYFIDFVIKLQDSRGGLSTILVEVKPEKFLRPPKTGPGARTLKEQRRIKRMAYAYGKNISKWDAAIKYAESHNMKFEIWSEVTLKKMGIL